MTAEILRITTLRAGYWPGYLTQHAVELGLSQGKASLGTQASDYFRQIVALTSQPQETAQRVPILFVDGVDNALPGILHHDRASRRIEPTVGNRGPSLLFPGTTTLEEAHAE